MNTHFPKKLTHFLLTNRFTGVHQASGLELVNTHYNLGNDFFESWLDKNMQYSCGYWTNNVKTLEDAQIAKMNLIGLKLKLEPGMRVLDIGCGWGSLAIYLAKNFGVTVVGINLSKNMIEYANNKLEMERNSNQAYNINVEYICDDFSKISELEPFDRIVSVGFYEHVCNDRYDEFYRLVADKLKDDGIMLIHTIGSNNDDRNTDPWIKKYIFTRGSIPDLRNIGHYAGKNNFVIEDIHNFGTDYEKTLLEWLKKFQMSTYLQKLNPAFYLMWEYYLASCAAAFGERELQLWQIVLTKKNYPYRYVGVR